jgi:ppGpp synthetase/RelA/SpoT-type nucleotidyltranferase
MARTVRKKKTLDDPNKTWLNQVLPSHERLAPIVQSLLESMLQKERIEYLNVTFRVKKIDEALKKISRKQYQEPKLQLTDLSGIRVVTFLEAQVVSINKLIRDLFEVDDKNSLDRTEVLGLDRLGYRSTHFVCTLGDQRAALPEYDELGDLKFEIQIRTVLQHAWAELAHDRSFKFAVALPTKIERKLNLYSGMLEIVDAAFDEISKEIDRYKTSLENKSITQISDAEIDSISLKRFIDETANTFGISLKANNIDIISDELKRFGIRTIGELQQLTTAEFGRKYKNEVNDELGIGFIRLIMMYSDIDRYFERTTPPWWGIPRQPYKFLVSKYGEAKVKQLLKKYKKSIQDDDGKFESQSDQSDEPV